MEWVNAVVQGVLLGGLYALFAAGLSLMFGVMRFVNLAHGDFIVLAAFGALALVDATGINPLWTLIVLVPVMATIGYVGQRLILNRLVGSDILPPILVTFGFAVILQNLLQEAFSADSQRISAGALDTANLSLGQGLSIGAVPVLMFVAAVVVLGALSWFLAKTNTGRLLRATSDDPEIVGLMGADRRHLFAIATSLASAVVAIAGVLMAIKTNFDPATGPIRLLFAFEAVIMGGLGSLWGTLAGGVILGVSQGLGAQIDPGFQVLAGHIVFLFILVLRPQGLFARQRG
ncbi:branched-chain amino acid ABC transporter permease [Pseudogemmobacter sp. W21_MBD1_M6]|uniref:branched-chain amino acid ABC transporter permease n=1 Tax=Pseudogemmobacter sp. W21_MBD1_M6 TaxID=3240271 RepID=UPI003F9A1FDC